MASRTSRIEVLRGRPPGYTGIKGSMSDHCSSVRSLGYRWVRIPHSRGSDPLSDGLLDGCYGLKDDGAAFVVRGDEDVRIDPTDAGAVGSFYEETSRGLGEALSKPFTDPPRRFGFAPPGPHPTAAGAARSAAPVTGDFPRDPGSLTASPANSF